MRKVTLLMMFVIIGSSSYAQRLEFKVRPINAIIYKKFQVGLEYGVSKHFGIELEPRIFKNAKRAFAGYEFIDNSIGGNLYGKYYFAPKHGYDRFNAGIYINGEQGIFKESAKNTLKGVEHTNFAVGAVIGYKWVIFEDITIETTFGLGRAFIKKYKDLENPTDVFDVSKEKYLNIDGLLRLSVGYRLGGGALDD